MASRSARGRQIPHDTMRTPERTRRSLSQGGGEDTPRPSASFNRDPPVPQQPHEGGATTQQNAVEQSHAAKRLGFLGEKLLSSNPVTGSSNGRGTTHQILPSRSHSRADSANLLARDAAVSPAPSVTSASSLHAKAHQSPSKLVSREMHRLGNLAHLTTLSPSAASSATLVPSSMSTLGGSSGGDTPWVTVHLHLLGLFNGEPLQAPIEDLNALVRRHIQTVVSAAPAKAMSALEHDATELISNGMVTLHSKLNGVEDDAVIDRVAAVWSDFWDNILPYTEGVLLPLQNDPLLASLYRAPKPQKPPSPVAQNPKSGASASHKVDRIDVRTIALRSFEEEILGRLDRPLMVVLGKERPAPLPQWPPRFQQMIYLCLSNDPQSRTIEQNPHPPYWLVSEVYAAIRRSPLRNAIMPSFLSAGLPRDRRGRVARKPEPIQKQDADDEGGWPWAAVPISREHNHELLEALKSPGPPEHQSARESKGWGLGLGEEKKAVEDDEDENLDWDQAQAVVERMVGLKSPDTPNAVEAGPSSGRRRPS